MTRFSLRDKWLFETSEVEITRVDCIYKYMYAYYTCSCYTFCNRVHPRFSVAQALLYASVWGFDLAGLSTVFLLYWTCDVQFVPCLMVLLSLNRAPDNVGYQESIFLISP